MNGQAAGWLLALDTSTASMTAALLKDGRLVAEDGSQAERNHSMYLLPMVERLLKEAAVESGQLGAIAVGVGPGSYTGVRIGVTAAKTMAWALNVPVLAVSSLEALAAGGWDNDAEGITSDEQGVWGIPLIDARRGQVYSAIFAGTPDSGIHQRLEEDGIRLLEPWTEQLLQRVSLADTAVRSIRFIGEIEPFAPLLEQFAARSGLPVQLCPHMLAAQHTGRIGWRMWQAGKGQQAHGLIPNYTQLPEAEAKLLRANQQQGGSGHGGSHAHQR